MSTCCSLELLIQNSSNLNCQQVSVPSQWKKCFLVEPHSHYYSVHSSLGYPDCAPEAEALEVLPRDWWPPKRADWQDHSYHVPLLHQASWWESCISNHWIGAIITAPSVSKDSSCNMSRPCLILLWPPEGHASTVNLPLIDSEYIIPPEGYCVRLGLHRLWVYLLRICCAGLFTSILHHRIWLSAFKGSHLYQGSTILRFPHNCFQSSRSLQARGHDDFWEFSGYMVWRWMIPGN